MPRIFYPLEGQPQAVRITGEKAHYLVTVLRCRAGDNLVMFGGRGLSYKGVIKSASKKEVLVEISEAFKENTESPLNIVLLQGLLKGEKMDLVIQKTTELGVKEIIPAITERSQLRETEKVSRWKKIAEEAARQCGRPEVPVIRDPIPLGDVFSVDSPYTSHLKTYKRLIFWEEGGSDLGQIKKRLEGARELMIAIGPEGGFAKGEVAEAQSKGFFVTHLGNRILRAETAAIAGAAIVQFLFGDLGQALHST